MNVIGPAKHCGYTADPVPQESFVGLIQGEILALATIHATPSEMNTSPGHFYVITGRKAGAHPPKATPSAIGRC